MPERGTSSGGQRKSKHFEQVKLQETTASPESPQPAEFKRKKHHTPATIPRTKLPAGTPIAERLALERLRQHLAFGEDEVSVIPAINIMVKCLLKSLIIS